MPNYTTIRYEKDGHLALVAFNRPQYRNAQSRLLIEELDAAFHEAEHDDDVHVLVLSGDGDHFSAGHDLGTPDEVADKEARPYQEGVRGRFKRSSDLYVEATLRWRNFPKPAIAAVQGYCIFGGWMIASACDVIFAADDARFLPTDFQYFSVPWDIHPRKVKAILFEGRFIDAEEACELGFVERVIPRESLMDEVLDYARRVAQNDPFQQRMLKTVVNQMQDGQGFTTHIRGAHGFYIVRTLGESDPDYALAKPGIKRRPMVQRALENYERHRARQQ